MQQIYYTDEDKRAIRRDYLAGKSIAALAIQYSADKTAYDSQKPRIRRILVEQGVRLRRRNTPFAHVSQETEIFSKGLLMQIEKKHDEMGALIAEMRRFVGAGSPVQMSLMGHPGEA